MIRAVFFDIDNTLLSFDDYVKETMKAGFARFGLAPYHEEMFDVFTRINDDLWRQIERNELTFEELKRIRWNIIFRAIGISFDGPTFETYFREQLNESAIPVPGAEELLAALHGRYLLCAVSNGPFRQQVGRLEKAGMRRFFSGIFISEEVGFSKPAREFFVCAFDRMNANLRTPVAPSEILVVGDSLTSDIAGGKNFGCRTCFFNPRGLPLPGENVPDAVISSLDELPRVLDALG